MWFVVWLTALCNLWPLISPSSVASALLVRTTLWALRGPIRLTQSLQTDRLTSVLHVC